MKESNWKMKFGAMLLVLSAVLYYAHYLIFNEAHHMFLFLLEDIAFIPIEVLFVSLILHKILEEREKKRILDKLNMLIGVFFSEVGTRVLDIFSSADPNVGKLVEKLHGIKDWQDKDFNLKSKQIREHTCTIDIDKVDVEKIDNFLKERHGFLLGLLQNPVLLEHETFTELLRALFHFEDELSHRPNFHDLKKEDLDHLKIDMERVYPLLIHEWIIYMQYLKKNHPYLFALAVKNNPFK